MTSAAQTGRTEHTNANGFRFYIERSKDFDAAGRMIDGNGWFAGLIDGRHDLSGAWFETRDSALDAITKYEGAV